MGKRIFWVNTVGWDGIAAPSLALEAPLAYAAPRGLNPILA